MPGLGPRPGMLLRGQVCGYAKLLIYIVIVVRSVLLLINSKIKLNLYLMYTLTWPGNCDHFETHIDHFETHIVY